MNESITLSKDQVFYNVATAAAYTGHKAPDEGELYDRVVTKEVDNDKLEEFWGECSAALAEKFHGVLVSQMETEERQYSIILDLSVNFNPNSKEGIRNHLTRFYTNGIIAKWFVYTNKAEAKDYAERAEASLSAAHMLAFEKSKPKRPTYDDEE